MMAFRLACSADLEAVASLYRDAAQNPYSVWDEAYPTLSDAQQDLNTHNLFVLTEDGQVIGTISIAAEHELDAFSIWQSPSSSCCEIARISVRRDFQGQGLASVIVRHILEVLRMRGCRSVRLSAASCNLPALKTYQKLGFLIQGEAHLYGGHYYLLEKIL